MLQSNSSLTDFGQLRKNTIKKYKEQAGKPLLVLYRLRGQDLNLRPSGYEPDELPDCSTPR